MPAMLLAMLALTLRRVWAAACTSQVVRDYVPKTPLLRQGLLADKP